MGIELELLVLLVLMTLGSSIFAVFKVETPRWRKALKWAIVIAGTIGLYYVVGHLALASTEVLRIAALELAGVGSLALRDLAVYRW